MLKFDRTVGTRGLRIRKFWLEGTICINVESAKKRGRAGIKAKEANRARSVIRLHSSRTILRAKIPRRQREEILPAQYFNRNLEIYHASMTTALESHSISSVPLSRRFWAFMDRTERHTNYPNLFRSTSLIHYLLVIDLSLERVPLSYYL